MNTTAVEPGGSVVQFAGVPVRLGRQWRILPPLSLGSLKRHGALIRDLHTKTIEEQATCAGTLVFEALRRNYPDITSEQVDEAVDMGNFQHLLQVTLGSSGLELVDKVPGGVEGNAVGLTGGGPPYMPTSQPASDTAGPTSTS